jgi:hypothetical protein
MGMFQFSMADHLMIWKFNDAPEAFRALSTFNGKEIWVAFVPKMYVGWAEGFKMGAENVHAFEWGKYGAKIYIAATSE